MIARESPAPVEQPNRDFGQLTCGDYETEKDAHDFFKGFFSGCPFFVYEPEVRGRRLYDDLPVSKDHDGQNLRIDGILHPLDHAFDAGWKLGPIGVEIKKSRTAVGPVIAQVLEQRQTLFVSAHLKGTRFKPTMFAVFPCHGVSHDLHSLFETQSILACDYSGYRDSIKFKMPGKNALEIIRADQWQCIVHPGFAPTTKKGHRGRQK